jgi:hypothetical protein
MDYLRDHWQGRHQLSRAFWVNSFMPFVLIALGETVVRPPVAEASGAKVAIALLYIAVAYLLILPWQLVGLWRSSRRYVAEQGDVGVATFAQAGIVIALVSAIGSSATTLQRVLGFHAVQADADLPPNYDLRVLREENAILIDGPFDVGLPRDVKALLAREPAIETVILNSDGGRIFEARGLARQIVEHGLDTSVLGHCRSACTVAFMAGKIRKIGKHGQLGFHSYALEAVMAFVDPLEEQEKDKAFFERQGVYQNFIERIFNTPHDDMWHPDIAQLLEANVVHQLIEG